MTQTALVMTTQGAQYQQAGLALISFLRDCGGTVVRSSRGAGSVLASDQLLLTSDIDWGTEASQAHSYGAVQLGSQHVLVNFNDVSADTTPQNIDIYLCQSAYTGGTLTTRCTESVASTENPSVLTVSLLPWGAMTAGTIFRLWSATAGVGIFWVKENGAAEPGFIFILGRPDASDTYMDGLRDRFLAVGANMQQIVAGGSSARIGAYDSTAGGIMEAHSVVDNFASWTLGVPADGRPRFYPVYWQILTTPTENARAAGTFQLIRATSSALLINRLDPQDPPSDLWEWRSTGGGGAVLWDKAVAGGIT